MPRAARDDGVDSPVRGGGWPPVSAGEGGRFPPSGDRRGGDHRRNHLGDAPGRLPDRHLPHAWPRDRPRHGPQTGDGGALRARGRLLARPRRVDAHLRPRAPIHGRLRDRRRQPAAGRRPRAVLRLQGNGRGDRVHVRRRCLQHRQLRRDDEPGRALEAPRGLPGGEQPLRHGDFNRAPLRGHRPLAKGRGTRGARGARRRDGRPGDARDGGRAHPHRALRSPADSRRGVHLPLPRPLRSRPGGVPLQGGGGGVAQEGPGQSVPRPSPGRGGDLRVLPRGAAGAARAPGHGRSRVRRRFAGAAARIALRPSLRGRRSGARLVRGGRAHPGAAPRRGGAGGRRRGRGPQARRGRGRLRGPAQPERPKAGSNDRGSGGVGCPRGRAGGRAPERPD